MVGLYFAEDPGHRGRTWKDQDNKGTDGQAGQYGGLWMSEEVTGHTLEFGQVMHILQYWIPKHSFVSYLSISSFHCGLRIITRIWEDSKIIKSLISGPWGSFPHFPMTTSPLNVFHAASLSCLLLWALFSQFPGLLQHCFQEDLPKKTNQAISLASFQTAIFSCWGWGPVSLPPHPYFPFIPEFFSRLATPGASAQCTSLHHSLEWLVISLGTSLKLDSQTAALVNILNFSWSHWLVSLQHLTQTLAQHLDVIMSCWCIFSPSRLGGAASFVSLPPNRAYRSYMVSVTHELLCKLQRNSSLAPEYIFWLCFLWSLHENLPSQTPGPLVHVQMCWLNPVPQLQEGFFLW